MCAHTHGSTHAYTHTHTRTRHTPSPSLPPSSSVSVSIQEPNWNSSHGIGPWYTPLTTCHVVCRARDRERERMKQSAAAAASTGPASGGCEDQDPPKTSQEFTRRWRSLKADPTARCRYLLLAGPKRLSKFFGSGADAILGDALIALDTGFASNDSAQMLAILDALAKTDRITLAIEFLSAAEREAAVNALGRIESAGGTTTPSAVDGDAVVPESAGEDKGATAAPVDLDIVARLQALFL